MKKTFISAAVVLIAASLTAACLSGCSEEEATSWTLSDTITASFSDNGSHGYILTVEGSGAMPDYASEKETPWYGRAGRVTEIVLDDGITYVGDNTFTGCAYVDYVILPTSVTSIGSNAFGDDMMVCAYSQVTAADNTTVYMYSEEQPTDTGDYWHMLGGVPAEWVNLKVLFIGNSFTYYNDIPSLFAEIANSAGAVVEVESIVHGSYNLARYANPNDVAEPTDDPNMKGDGKTVDETLRANDDYDIIILQEQSTRPISSYDLFLQGASDLNDKIQETQKDCDVYLYATWGYPKGLDNNYKTVPDMEAALRQAYKNVAKAIGADICSVGEAFTYVYNNYKDINLYHTDDQHPSYAGSYLSACVHAATITGCDPRETTFIGSLDAATAEILQNVAYDIVFGN